MCYDTAIVCNLNKYRWIETKHFACFVSLINLFLQNPLLTIPLYRKAAYVVGKMLTCASWSQRHDE